MDRTYATQLFKKNLVLRHEIFLVAAWLIPFQECSVFFFWTFYVVHYDQFNTETFYQSHRGCTEKRKAAVHCTKSFLTLAITIRCITFAHLGFQKTNSMSSEAFPLESIQSYIIIIIQHYSLKQQITVPA